MTALELPEPTWSVQAFMPEANEGWMSEFLVGARRKTSRAEEVSGGDLKETVDGYRTTHPSRDPERFLNWSSVANLENSSARNMEETKAQKRKQQKREQNSGGYIPKGTVFRNNWDQRRSTPNPT